eukprot:370521-Prorocentrum_minimum.AAC.1
MTSPSTPALWAMRRHGATSAFCTMSAPRRSSSSSRVAANSGTICDRCTSVAPPPGTMPSSTAAKVAFLASSMRSLRSSSSVSVAAPTCTPVFETDKKSIASFYGSCCANNGEDALNTPDENN